MEKLKIAVAQGELLETEAQVLKINGHKCFVNEWTDGFTVSEYKSGLRISKDEDKNKAIIEAVKILSEKSHDQIMKAARGELQFHGIIFPVNI